MVQPFLEALMFVLRFKELIFPSHVTLVVDELELRNSVTKVPNLTNLSSMCTKIIIALVVKIIAKMFAEKLPKSPKVVTIASTPN
jgi:hypothetical protein